MKSQNVLRSICDVFIGYVCFFVVFGRIKGGYCRKMGGMIYWKQIKESEYVRCAEREIGLAHTEMRYDWNEGGEKIGA